MKNLKEYETPETDEAIRASESMPTFQMEIISLRSDLRNMERRLAACREALALVKEMHEHEATGDPDQQPTGEGRERHANIIRETLAATARP